MSKSEKTTKSSKTRYYKPPNTLREKVGTGGISQLVLQRSEEFIDENDLDFRPYAREMIDRFDRRVKNALDAGDTDKKTIDRLAQPIMELKASGGMFKYRLLSEISDVLLDFLENIQTLNSDAFEIIIAHQSALRVIVNHNLKGTGGQAGRVLSEELYSATKRYYSKYNVTR